MKRKNEWIKIVIGICVLAAIVGYFVYDSYRGLDLWNLRTAEVKAFQQTVQEMAECKVTVKYRAFQLVEITCQTEEWEKQEVEAVMEEVKEMIAAPEFQKSYTKAYAKRYQTAEEESVPQVVMVYFQNGSKLITAYSYSSAAPFTEWSQIK